MRLSEQALLLLSSLPSIVGQMSKVCATATCAFCFYRILRYLTTLLISDVFFISQIMASHVAHAGGIVGLQSSAEIYLEHCVTM